MIEDLHVKGMLANDKLARAISDVGFGMFRSQIEYKAKRYGTRLVIADAGIRAVACAQFVIGKMRG